MLNKKDFMNLIDERLKKIGTDDFLDFVNFAKKLSDDEIRRIEEITKKYTRHKDIYSVTLDYHKFKDLKRVEEWNKKELDFYNKYLKD